MPAPKNDYLNRVSGCFVFTNCTHNAALKKLAQQLLYLFTAYVAFSFRHRWTVSAFTASSVKLMHADRSSPPVYEQDVQGRTSNNMDFSIKALSTRLSYGRMAEE